MHGIENTLEFLDPTFRDFPDALTRALGGLQWTARLAQLFSPGPIAVTAGPHDSGK